MLARDWSWSPKGGWEDTGGKRSEEPPPTHTPPGSTPGYLLRCLTLRGASAPPAPAGTSGAPARRPPPALGSCCRLSRYRSGLRPVGGAASGAGPQRQGPVRLGAGAAAGSARRRSARTERPAGARPSPVSRWASDPRPRNGNSVTCVPTNWEGKSRTPSIQLLRHTATVSEHLLSIGTALHMLSFILKTP